MKLKKKTIKEITDMAVNIYTNQPTILSWDTKRDFIDESDKRTLAYIKAFAIVTKTEVDLEFYKQVSKSSYIKG